MRKALIYTVSTAVILFCSVLVIVVITGGGSQSGVNDNHILETPESIESTFTIDVRDFKMGVAGFIPRNFPDHNFSDTRDFWEKVEQAGELYGVHTDWKQVQVVDVTVASSNRDLVVVLGWQEPTEWGTEPGDFVTTAKGILGKYRQIKYLGIGNEVNLLADKYPQEFPEFISSYKEIYTQIKESFPEVKIFPTFQYDDLQGDVYLMGKAENNPQFELLSEFEDSMDLAVFTTYPYLQYKSPAEIPLDYFTQVENYTLKAVAFTETGWIGRDTYPGNLEFLIQEGYGGSQVEQVEYIDAFVQLTSSMEVEFVDWAFLHDLADWQGGEVQADFPIFDSTGLHNHDGTSKASWDRWLELKSLPIQ